MAYELLHHGLIVVPDHWAPGIHWLRLYRKGNDSVAVITNVPGNPGGSATNRIKHRAQYVIEAFGIDPARLTLFEIWPRGFSHNGATYKRVDVTGDHPRWTATSRKAIEALVGEPLLELPEHADLYGQVVELGGGNWDDVWRPTFKAVPVSELPPPHLPARCEHATRFHEIEASLVGEYGSPADRKREVGRRFVASLSEEDRRLCYYHQDDWRSIAEEGVRILEQLGPADVAEYLAAVIASSLPETERCWLHDLFADPIFISGDEYTDGQHRSCALRFSGAERGVVEVGREHVGQVCDDWTYEGGG